MGRNDDSFEEFFAATYGRLVGLLFAVLHDRAQAEDVVQEAFASALLRWRSIRGYQDPEAWVRMVAFRRAVDGRRRVRNALMLAVAGVLALVGGVRLLPEQRERAVVPVPPGGAPATFIGLAQQDETARLAVIDAVTGRVRRWLPGVKLSGTNALDPGLRKLYRYQWDKAPCARTWTEVDLTTGATRPAFGGRPVAPAPIPSPDGR